MKLVLCSEGFATENTVQACVDLCKKPKNEISVAIINEAFAVEKGDKRWVLNNLYSVFKNFSAEVDIVNLLALPIDEVEKRISDKDVVFVVGGNTDYLMKVFKKTGFDMLLPRLLDSKVYVGSSAGSMVIGHRISEAAYKLIYGEDSKYDVSEYLGLVDFSIMPHLDSLLFPNRESTLKDAVGIFNGKVYGLRDDSAIVVNGDKIDVIGSSPVVIN
jgi:dipeptidase E